MNKENKDKMLSKNKLAKLLNKERNHINRY